MSKTVRRGTKIDSRYFVANRNLGGLTKDAGAGTSNPTSNEQPFPQDLDSIMVYLKAEALVVSSLIKQIGFVDQKKSNVNFLAEWKELLSLSAVLSGLTKLQKEAIDAAKLLDLVKLQEEAIDAAKLLDLTKLQEEADFEKRVRSSYDWQTTIHRADLSQYPELIGHSSRMTRGLFRIGATVIENSNSRSIPQKSIHDAIHETLKTLRKESKDKKRKTLFKKATIEHEENRKKAKRDFWLREKTNTATLLENKLNSLGFRFIGNEQRVLRELIALRAYTELNDEDRKRYDAFSSSKKENEPVLHNRRSVLRWHKKVTLQQREFDKRIKALDFGNDEQKKQLIRLNNQLSLVSKRYLDPHYEYAPLTTTEKVRLYVKRALILVAAVAAGLALLGLIGIAGVALFSPLAPLAATLGFVGMVGMLPLLDTIGAVIINAIRWKRAPTKLQITEMRAAAIAVPFLFISSGLVKLCGNVVQTIANFFSHKPTATSIGQGSGVAANYDKKYIFDSFGTVVNSIATAGLTWLYRKMTKPAHNKGELKKREFVSFENAKGLLNSNAQDDDRLVKHMQAINKTKQGHGRTYVYNDKDMAKPIHATRVKLTQAETGIKAGEPGVQIESAGENVTLIKAVESAVKIKSAGKDVTFTASMHFFKVRPSKEFIALRKTIKSYQQLSAGASYEDRDRRLLVIRTALNDFNKKFNAESKATNTQHSRDVEQVKKKIEPFVKAERAALERINPQLSDDDKRLEGRLILAYR